MRFFSALLLLVSIARCDGFLGDVALTRRNPAVKQYRVPTDAMEPTIPRQSVVNVDESAFATTRPDRGDVVAYRLPAADTLLVKRVVALPGDVVQVVGKELRVNGRAVSEPYVVHEDPRVYAGPHLAEPFRSRDNFGPITVPPDHYFLLGDNRDNSNDSRYHGPVPRQLISGKLVNRRAV
jgi:signal peptidase I